MRTVRKKASLSLHRQRTHYQTNQLAGECAAFSLICFLVMLSVVTCGIVRLIVTHTLSD